MSDSTSGMVVSFRQKFLKAIVNFYPPFLGAGVRSRRSESGGFIVELKLRWWNKNYVGTQFGGSLYLMCDPWFMIILMEQLGSDYLVWDQNAKIQFKRPGRSTVRARFEISAAEVEQVKREIEADGVSRPTFLVDVVDEKGRVIAEVEKGLWAARKKRD